MYDNMHVLTLTVTMLVTWCCSWLQFICLQTWIGETEQHQIRRQSDYVFNACMTSLQGMRGDVCSQVNPQLPEIQGGGLQIVETCN